MNIEIGSIVRFTKYSSLTEGQEPIFEPGQSVLIEKADKQNGEILYTALPVDLFGEPIEHGKGDQLFEDEIELIESESEIAPGAVDPDVQAQHESRKYTLHPITDKFPEMSDAAYGELREDIKKNKQLVPIVALPDSRIIDGKHRFLACQELGIPPVVEVYEGPQDEKSLLEYVRSLNARRRHLTADEVKAFAIKRQQKVKVLKAEGKTTRQIAEEAGVGQTTIQRDLNKLKKQERIKVQNDNLEPPGSSGYSSTKSKTSQNSSKSSDAADTTPKNKTPSEEDFEMLTMVWRSSVERQWKASTKTAQKRFAAWVTKQHKSILGSFYTTS